VSAIAKSAQKNPSCLESDPVSTRETLERGKKERSFSEQLSSEDRKKTILHQKVAAAKYGKRGKRECGENIRHPKKG